MKHLYSAVLTLTSVVALAVPALAVNDLRISQVYGAGGNAGATYNADFVELYNAGTSAASLTGFSIQYAATTGTSWTRANLSGSVAPGGYFLIQMSATGANGAALPAPDAAPASISMAAGAGKVALVSNQTTITSGTSCPATSILDFVGYGSGTNCFEGGGPTATISATLSAARKNSFTNKNIDTDSNSADFVTTTPCPRNSAVAPGTDPCGPTPTLRSAWGTLKSLYR